MIIAECGQNHCGDMNLARRLIELAKDNGADLVKFQLYDHNMLYKDCPEIPDVSLYFDQAKMLFDYGKQNDIEVFFSVFDVERVKWCEEIGVKRYKIAYSQQNNNDLISFAQSKGETIVSCDNPTVGNYVLYCVPHYPTKLEELRFTEWENIFDDLYDGFSDHTIGLDAAKIALARGARIIEKHFAKDHQTGVDALWSMTPGELRELKRWEGVVKKIT